MKKIFSMLLGVVLIMSVVVLGVGCGDAPLEEQYWEWADLWPMSGPYAGWGLIWHASSEVWAEEVNANGGIEVGGETYMVRITEYDNQADPTVALTQANKAIYDDGINFISSASADESVAVNELCNEEKVIHVACSPGLGDALSSDFPYTFQTWPEDIEAQSVALEACKDQYPAYTTVAVIAPDNLRGQEAVAHIEEIAPTYGFNMTHSTYVALDEVDFYPVLTPIIDADVDVLLNPGLGYAEGGQMVKQARELGHNKSIVYTDTMDYDVVVDITGEDALEGIIVTPQQAEMFTEAGQAWAEKYIEKYGSLQYWASYRYDELSLFKLAIEEADSFDPDDILAVIGNVSYEGISGETRFATNVYSPDLPRYMKMQIPAVMIQDGEMVDIYQGYSFIWD